MGSSEADPMKKVLYRGKYLTIEQKSFKIAGKTILLPKEVKPDVVVIAPVLQDGRFLIERQYRHSIGKHVNEFPAGHVDAGELPEVAARRELEEETGYKAEKWSALIEYFASPGFLGESMKVFVAEGLTAGGTHWDDDEEIELRLVKMSELLKMIEKGAILDGKTLTSVLLYARLQSRRKK